MLHVKPILLQLVIQKIESYMLPKMRVTYVPFEYSSCHAIPTLKELSQKEKKK
jgi:hypothetical protein